MLAVSLNLESHFHVGIEALLLFNLERPVHSVYYRQCSMQRCFVTASDLYHFWKTPVSIFEQELNPCTANSQPLSPVSFLRRAAAVRPEQTAIVHGKRRYSPLPLNTVKLKP